MTAVRVVARVRPAPPSSLRCAWTTPPVVFVREGEEEAREFTLDAAFPEGAGQEDVFVGACGGMVAEVVAGFNATVLAYGQTGSGKSFTMMGPPGNEGVIPRLATGLFEALQRPGATAVEVTVRVSYVEIFLERLIDLLVVNGEAANNVRIRELADGKVVLEGAREVFCTNAQEVMDVLQRGNAMRSVGATRMNADSSRSHSIFTMQVEQVHRAPPGRGEVVSSKLVLVDLAGSESVKKTGAAGDRLEEAKAINQSLSALGNVINALVEKRTHVPYRDAKLTRILQDSLGGNAKTCLIITLSPVMDNAFETLSTLRFGQRAKRVANHAVRNVRRSTEELERLLAAAERRIAELTTGLGGGVLPGPPVQEATMAEVEELTARLDDLTTSLGISNAALAETRTQAEDLAEDRKRLTETLFSLEERIADLSLTNKRLAVDVRTREAEVETLRTEVSVLTRELDSAPRRRASPLTQVEAVAQRDSDVQLLTEKCVRLQLALFEKEEELDLMRSKSASGELWARLGKANEEVGVLRQQARVATANLETLHRRHEVAMASRQEHIDMLENALVDFQVAFRGRIEAHQKAELEYQGKIAELTGVIEVLTRPSPPGGSVVARPLVVASPRLPRQAEEEEEEGEEEEHAAAEQALVVFKLHDPATSQAQLKALPERSFWFASRRLTVKQHWKPDGRGGTELGFGAVVYPACLLLCDYLCTRNPGAVQGKRVLELGCGLGLVSMVARCAGASVVVATDGDTDSVAFAFENVSRNGFSAEEVSTAVLRWGDERALSALVKSKGGFDVIVASDVVAVPYAEALEGLVKTVGLVGADTMWVAYSKRHAREERFFELMKGEGWGMSVVRDVGEGWEAAEQGGSAGLEELFLVRFVRGGTSVEGVR